MRDIGSSSQRSPGRSFAATTELYFSVWYIDIAPFETRHEFTRCSPMPRCSSRQRCAIRPPAAIDCPSKSAPSPFSAMPPPFRDHASHYVISFDAATPHLRRRVFHFAVSSALYFCFLRSHFRLYAASGHFFRVRFFGAPVLSAARVVAE